MNTPGHLKTASRLTHVGVGKDEATGAISYPIYPSATCRHPAVGESTGFDYTRSGNPTRQVLENALAELEGGARACVFSSGMAALTTLFLYFRSEDHLIVSQDLYGGTYRVLVEVFDKLGLRASYVDTTDTAAVKAAIEPESRALLVETPGNPLLGVADLAALGEACRKHELLFVVDNTFLTPALQRPFDFGADVVVHSATKYLGGHNDLCAGVLVAREETLGERLYFLQNSTGGILSFRVDSQATARQVLKRLKLISFAESLGGVESLMTLPAVQTHGDIPEPERRRLGICESLLRLSVGIEDVGDIIADLEQALGKP